MATVVTQRFGTAASVTITLASLASTSGLASGRASTVITSSATECVDFMVGGLVTASSQTLGSSNKQYEIWSYGTYEATGVNYTGGATGSDADLTTVSKSNMRLLTVIPTAAVPATSSPYAFGPFSIAQAYGGALPSRWGIFVTHNSCTAIHAGVVSSYNEIRYTPVYYQSS